MKMKLAAWLLGAASMVVATTASAAMVTYDLRGTGGNLGSYENFGNMQASARNSDNGFSVSGVLWQTTSGLGVRRSGSDSSQVDGNGVDEGIQFTFGSTVTLLDATFGALTGNDDFNLAVWNGSWTTVLDDQTSLGGNTYTGRAFRIWADAPGDDFYVRSLKIDDRRDVAAVPEPATLALLGLGMIAVGVSRRQS